MKVIYRISDTGYDKIKPEYINNQNCLKNAVESFKNAEWLIIADNVSDSTKKMIETTAPHAKTQYVSVGHGAGTFNIALDIALTFDSNDIVYFLENDYLHKSNSEKVLHEGINLGYHYVSLYDHPDKYINGANPLVEEGGEVTRVLLSNSCHWKITNSTTMTFASYCKVLKEDELILRKYTNGTYPRDFEMFMELRNIGHGLITPIPGYSTHGETAWLAPLTDWDQV